MVWILTFASCAACLQLPDDESRDDSGHPSPTDLYHPDTADTGGGIDTPPPLVPRCTLEDVEDEDPTNDFSQILEVPLSTYACGYVDRYRDLDYLSFTTTEPGWVSVDVQAASRGSSADMYMQLDAPDLDDGVGTEGRPRSSDPLNVFYAPQGAKYIATLNETTGGYGDAYGWWFLAGTTKAPVAFGMIETEPNSSIETAIPLAEGVRYYGTIGDAGDGDWYAVDIPAGTTVVTYETDAAQFGSAMDPVLRLVWGGTNQMLAYDDHWDDRNDGVDSWGELEIAKWQKVAEDLTAKEPERYPGTNDFTKVYFRVSNTDELKSSMFHWYVFWVTFSSEVKE